MIGVGLGSPGLRQQLKGDQLPFLTAVSDPKSCIYCRITSALPADGGGGRTAGRGHVKLIHGVTAEMPPSGEEGAAS